MKFELITRKPQLPHAPTTDFDSAAHSESLLQPPRGALHGISDLRDQLEELRRNLINYGPAWYDADQDDRLAASLALLDQMMPVSASDCGPALVTETRKSSFSARS